MTSELMPLRVRPTCMRRAAIVLLVVASACANSASTSALDSGVQGRVLYGPLCPVQRAGSPCPDRPYKATLRVDDANGHEVKTIATSDSGTFKIDLPPGAYVITPVLSQSPPTGHPQDVTVRAHEYATITVTIDSGIR